MQTHSSESTSRSLIRRAAANDPEAWRRLSLVYGPLVYQWCRHCGLQPDDAADVVQEVTDAGLVHFKDCKNLTHLTLSNSTKVTDTDIAHIGKLSRLGGWS